MRNLLMRVTTQNFYILRNKLMRMRPILGILRNYLMRNSISNLVKIAQKSNENPSNGPQNLKKFFSKKKAEFINANDRNFQVLRNLILRKRAKFALINSALIHSRINLFP